MLTRVTVRGDYLRICIACTDLFGAAVDPAQAQAYFFKVSQENGGLFLDSNIGSSGVLTLSKEGSHTGFYGAALDLGGLPAAQYVVLFKAQIEGIDTIAVDYLELGEDEHLYRCVANAVYNEGDDLLTVNAWLVDHSGTVNFPADVEFTLYDDTGTELFQLASFDADDNGVFRVTRSEPGLTLGKAYYGKVEIYDGFEIYSSLVGLVTV